jgi:hypothetical protein
MIRRLLRQAEALLAMTLFLYGWIWKRAAITRGAWKYFGGEQLFCAALEGGDFLRAEIRLEDG